MSISPFYKNDFPDSPEKDFLRKLTLYWMEEFIDSSQNYEGSYLGMTGVEFKDILCWKQILSKVTAVDRETDNIDKMLLNRDLLNLTELVHIRHSDIYDKINSSDKAFDIYNLDFLGGFLYKKEQNSDSLKKIFLNQKLAKKDFILIYTFKLRDTGRHDYQKVLDDLYRSIKDDYPKKELKANENDNRKDFSMLLKTAFLAEIQTNANTNSFIPRFKPPVRYISGPGNSMIYFYSELRFSGNRLACHDISGFKNILEMQVLRLKGNQMETHIRPNVLIRR